MEFTPTRLDPPDPGAAPDHFGDARAEIAAARSACAIAAAPSHGLIELRGRDHAGLLQRLSAADVGELAPGQGRANVFLTAKGRILHVFDQLTFQEFTVLAFEGGPTAPVAQWIDRFVFAEDVQTNPLEEWRELRLIGPERCSVLQQLDLEVAADWRQRDHTAEWGGGPIVGLAGPSAVRLLVDSAAAESVWHRALAAGATPAGRVAVDTLRIAGGHGAPGAEYSEAWNPYETGLAERVSLTKGCFTGQEVVARLHNYNKVHRTLIGVHFETLPATPAAILLGEQPIGKLTSAIQLADDGAAIGLAVVESSAAKPGTQIRAGDHPGTLQSLPMELNFLA